MSEHGRVRYGDREIEYRVVRSARRKKTVAIRLEPNGEVIVSSPQRVPAAQLAEFVRARAGWILRRAAEVEPAPVAAHFTNGQTLPYLGGTLPLLIEPSSARSAVLRFDEGRLRIEAPAGWTEAERQATIERLLLRWYRARALSDVRERVTRWAARSGGVPRAVLVRDQRWRWGSCSADGTLRFNWRLIMADPALIDYVVVHELVHLRVKDHSAAYWAAVATLMPDHKQRRARLRAIGPSLNLSGNRE
jgi:predicted metal-dependent hydrolase